MIKFRQKNFGMFGWLAGSKLRNTAKNAMETFKAAEKSGKETAERLAKMKQNAENLQSAVNKVGGRRAALIGGGVAATGIGMMGTTMANGITGDGGMN
jgi:hypothetical protein